MNLQSRLKYVKSQNQKEATELNHLPATIFFVITQSTIRLNFSIVNPTHKSMKGKVVQEIFRGMSLSSCLW